MTTQSDTHNNHSPRQTTLTFVPKRLTQYVLTRLVRWSDSSRLILKFLLILFSIFFVALLFLAWLRAKQLLNTTPPLLSMSELADFDWLEQYNLLESNIWAEQTTGRFPPLLKTVVTADKFHGYLIFSHAYLLSANDTATQFQQLSSSGQTLAATTNYLNRQLYIIPVARVNQNRDFYQLYAMLCAIKNSDNLSTYNKSVLIWLKWLPDTKPIPITLDEWAILAQISNTKHPEPEIDISDTIQNIIKQDKIPPDLLCKLSTTDIEQYNQWVSATLQHYPIPFNPVVILENTETRRIRIHVGILDPGDAYSMAQSVR